MSSSVTLSAVSFAWPQSPALFEGLNLTLTPGWTGLVGENGAGKSTLLGLLAGTLRPQRGAVTLRPAGVVTLCGQEVERPDALVLRLEGARDASALALRARLQLPPDGPGRWPTLSVGERRRWQLAAALWSEPDVLLLDEPSDPLDDAGRALLLSALRRHRGVGVLVSHDRALLDELCGVTLRVTPGQVRRFDEPYTAAAARWRAEEEAERRRWEESARQLKRAEHRHDQARRDREAADHQVSARVRMKGPKDSDARGILARGRAEMGAAAQAKRAAAARRRVEGLSETLARPPTPAPLGAALRLGGVSAPRERLLSLPLAQVKVAGRPLAGPAELSLSREDRVWLRGPNGAGKTTLLRALAEASRLPPERLFVLPQTFTEAEVQALLAEAHGLSAEARGQLGHRLAALGVAPERVWSSRRPSPGEARKLALALALHREVWLMLLDEPSNHLDLPSVERLEAALGGVGGAFVLVTHDAQLAQATCRRVWRIEGGLLTEAPLTR
ncbi:ATP-binding cassette domain-containing protein [Myxococcota bacterium]|nr:ATP-binding cassette domain-containing protein [Myxococcota bacterium]